jgi:hypothetical protein
MQNSFVIIRFLFRCLDLIRNYNLLTSQLRLFIFILPIGIPVWSSRLEEFSWQEGRFDRKRDNWRYNIKSMSESLLFSFIFTIGYRFGFVDKCRHGHKISGFVTIVPGWIFTKLFTQICKNFRNFRPLNLEFFNAKSAF